MINQKRWKRQEFFWGERRKKSRNVLKQCKRSKAKQYHKWTIPEVKEIRTSEEAQGSSPIARQSPKQADAMLLAELGNEASAAIIKERK
jgi:hypothetical protein